MHTVIILSKHSSDLLREFRFLFQPFINNGTISFCDWNESGIDLETSVPDLYKLIKGKMKWRAVIISAEPVYGKRIEPVPDASNPFDFPQEVSDNSIPKDSTVPLVRLSHMICGYPAAPVKNFESGYEYTDEHTGKLVRVRTSQLSDEDLCLLSKTYGSGLKSIYIQEKVSEEVEQARKELGEKYGFSDVRPQEVYMIATRRHPEDENYIYDSWKSPFEMESSDFCRRNNYPGICRFLCYNITNSENSKYMKELTKFWLAVLTVSVNKIPASTLQAFKLYQLEIEVSAEELSKLLNDHLNKLEAALMFVQERMRMKPENTFEEGEKIVEKQHIPVMFSENARKDLYINTSRIGLSKDCPGNELEYWNIQMQEKYSSVERFLKMPRRAIDRAASHVKSRAESFFDNEYEMDRFQMEELQDELAILEAGLLTGDTRSVIDEQKIRGEMLRVDHQVKKDITVRMRKGIVIKVGILLLLLYMLGYVSYIIEALGIGKQEFLSSLGVMFAATFFASIGGITALIMLRKKLVKSMERFNDLMRELVKSVNGSAKKFENYFSILCTYMKAQSIYSGIVRKTDKASARALKLRTHRQALKMSIERDEELAAAFGVKRIADFEKNVTRFFEEDKLPQDNRFYYYEPDDGKTDIPLNKTGDMICTPYKFIIGLTIKRENLYEEGKGENAWQK